MSLRLNAFFSKNDVKCAQTRYFALKTRFLLIIGFNAMKALGNVETHWNCAELGYLGPKQAFP